MPACTVSVFAYICKPSMPAVRASFAASAKGFLKLSSIAPIFMFIPPDTDIIQNKPAESNPAGYAVIVRIYGFSSSRVLSSARFFAR